MVAKKASLISIAFLAAACSGGGSDGSDVDTPPVGTPPVTNVNSAPVIATSALNFEIGTDATYVITATDADGDTITFSLVSGPDWVSLSADGTLSGTPTTDDTGAFDLVVEASDNMDLTRATITLRVFMDPVSQALTSGDYKFISEGSDMEVDMVLLDTIEAIIAQHKADIAEIYQLGPNGAIEATSLLPAWNEDDFGAGVMQPTFGHNAPLLATFYQFTVNPETKQHSIGILGRHESGARYVAYGATPLTGDYDPDRDLHQMVANSITWLNEGALGDDTNIVITATSESMLDIRIRDWIDDVWGDLVTYNDFSSCVSDEFSACIADDTDMIFVFQHDISDAEAMVMRDRLEKALQDGIGVMFFDRPNSGNGLLRVLMRDLMQTQHASDFLVLEEVRGARSVDYVYSWTPSAVENIRILVSQIINDTIDFDLSACSGSLECEENPDAGSALINMRNSIMNITDELSEAGIDPFKTREINRFTRALLLTGDYYRDQIGYPLSKDSTPSAEIFRALFGELSQVLNRESTPSVTDLGTYSRTLFDATLKRNQTVSVMGLGPFRTSGVYAFPGETVRVTRTDATNTRTWVRVQSLSEASAAPFATIGEASYDRPVFVTSAELEIEPGEPLSFTSPYGGPIHIVAAQSDRELTFEFENVGTHPVWRSGADSEAFLIALTADEYDWVEMVTPYFEIHAMREKMLETLSLVRYNNDPTRLALDIEQYLQIWPLWFEGVQGGDIPVIASLDEHRITEDYAARSLSSVQHLNMDRAACENGCIGNPFEMNWGVDPFSKRDQLIMFNQLETFASPNRALADFAPHRGFNFQDSDAAAISELSFLHTHFRHFEETGELLIECPALPHEDLYALVQAAHQSQNPQSFITNTDLSSVEAQMVLYLQMKAALQEQGVLQDGWELWPLLNHYERRWSRSTILWGGFGFTDGVALGYGQNSVRDVALRSDANGWLLIALSWITERDMTAYLEMWGYEFPDFARNLVANYGFESVVPAYYAFAPTDHCTSLAHDRFPIDGTTQWPG